MFTFDLSRYFVTEGSRLEKWNKQNETAGYADLTGEYGLGQGGVTVLLPGFAVDS